jgi:hypothetical protein
MRLRVGYFFGTQRHRALGVIGSAMLKQCATMLTNSKIALKMFANTISMFSSLFIGAIFTQALVGQWPAIGRVPDQNDAWTKLISDQSESAPNFPQYSTCVSEYDWAFTYGTIIF